MIAGSLVRMMAKFSRGDGRPYNASGVRATVTTSTSIKNYPVASTTLGEYWFEMILPIGAVEVEFACSVGVTARMVYEGLPPSGSVLEARDMVVENREDRFSTEDRESREKRMRAFRDQWKKPLPNSKRPK